MWKGSGRGPHLHIYRPPCKCVNVAPGPHLQTSLGLISKGKGGDCKCVNVAPGTAPGQPQESTRRAPGEPQEESPRRAPGEPREPRETHERAQGDPGACQPAVWSPGSLQPATPRSMPEGPPTMHSMPEDPSSPIRDRNSEGLVCGKFRRTRHSMPEGPPSLTNARNYEGVGGLPIWGSPELKHKTKKKRPEGSRR
jgi:hypothetical protein